MAHLLPDESDERKWIARRKKHVAPCPFLPSPAATISDEIALQDGVILPALTRVTTSSREGCAPNPPRLEVNRSTHTVTIERCDNVMDMTNSFWSALEPNGRTPELLMQPVAVTNASALVAEAVTGVSSSNSLALTNSIKQKLARRSYVIHKSDVLAILPQLDALTSVNIRHNYALQVLPLEALHHLPYLKVLDLSHNALHHLPSILFLRPTEKTASGTTAAFPDLLELRLNNNHLSWVPKEVFTATPRLQRLTLDNNILGGFPSTLGNHAMGSSLATLTLHNNVLSAESEDSSEVEHCAAAYDKMIFSLDVHLATVKAGGVLTREKEKDVALQMQRLPLSRKVVGLEQLGPFSPEGTRVLHQLLKRELERAEIGGGVDTTFYSGSLGWRFEKVTCNMCQAPLASQFQAYRLARNKLVEALEREAMGPLRFRLQNNDDFSFFLAGDDVPRKEPVAAVDGDDAAHRLPWEQDEELLWMIGEALNNGMFGGKTSVLGKDRQVSRESQLLSMTSCCPPYCCSKFIDVADNKDVPLLYFICGSEICKDALNSLSCEGGAAQNYSRIDYSRGDPSDDDN